VLNLSVSIATTKRVFFATRLRSKMKNEFLADHLVVYIEKEISKDFTTEMIMKEFYSIKSSIAN